MVEALLRSQLHLASFRRNRPKMARRDEDQEKLDKVVESETQIVDSPDALVLSSDPNHVCTRLDVRSKRSN